LLAIQQAEAATTTARLESRFTSGTTPSANVYVRSGLTDSLTFTSFFATSRSYAEGYVGLAYAPSLISGLVSEFEVSIGQEQASGSLRREASVFFLWQRLSHLTVVEDGGSGVWYYSQTTWRPHSLIGVGVMGQRYLGWGPRIDFSIPHTPLTVWGAYSWDREFDTNAGTLGVQAKF